MEQLNISPKNTFRNLPEDKQRRITVAAVHEFAEYGYRQASVNRIVKETRIAKGSLYQYFAGKEALYLHVFSDFIELIKQTVKENETRGERELFSRIRFVIKAGLKFINSHPEYFRLYTRLLSEEESPCRSELLAQVRFFPVEYFEPLIREGQKSGVIRGDIQAELIVFMIDAVLDRFLLSVSGAFNGVSVCPVDSANVETVVEQIIAMLAGGITGSVDYN